MNKPCRRRRQKHKYFTSMLVDTNVPLRHSRRFPVVMRCHGAQPTRMPAVDWPLARRQVRGSIPARYTRTAPRRSAPPHTPRSFRVPNNQFLALQAIRTCLAYTQLTCLFIRPVGDYYMRRFSK